MKYACNISRFLPILRYECCIDKRLSLFLGLCFHSRLCFDIFFHKGCHERAIRRQSGNRIQQRMVAYVLNPVLLLRMICLFEDEVGILFERRFFGRIGWMVTTSRMRDSRRQEKGIYSYVQYCIEGGAKNCYRVRFVERAGAFSPTNTETDKERSE